MEKLSKSYSRKEWSQGILSFHRAKRVRRFYNRLGAPEECFFHYHFREELFVQAKLWNSNHRPEHVKADLMATLKDLQLTYLDSFVIHWPQAVPSTGKNPTLRPNGCYPAHHSKSIINKLIDMSIFQFSVYIILLESKNESKHHNF